MGDQQGVSSEELNAEKSTLESCTSSLDTRMSSLESKIEMMIQSIATLTANRTMAVVSPEDAGSASEAAPKAAEGAKTAESNHEKNKDSYHVVPPIYTPADPYVSHPHINNIGNPPKINTVDFERWQYEFRSYMCRSCNALWKIVEKGFRPLNDSDNYTNREEVEAQLNSVALHMIQQAVGEKDLPFIMKYTVAKDAWDELLKLYIGNESMRHNKYSTLKNQAEGFMKKRDEDHQDMYARLMTVSTAFRNVGANHIDDKWVKEKYVEALWPYEAQDLKTLMGRHNYYEMSSH